jgi:osmoprotectant transport system ATP-binding protein
VIQSIGLLPHRTIAQNISTVPKLIGWDDARIRERVEELVGMLERHWLDIGLMGKAA